MKSSLLSNEKSQLTPCSFSLLIVDRYEPVWNERFVFNIHPEEDTIHFDVYDADVGDKDLIGTGKVKLTNVFDDGKFDDWVKLPAHLSLPVHEEIHVTMNFIPA
ncbi:unnamed protein product [Rotaria socialis]|uniref:C2 domain-containing protein n=1 Tax=Rotaria socialis TaxID=392032 RepID=A0A817W0D7_9BILA|nr:unnamed protein product [Rotaria socialis]